MTVDTNRCKRCLRTRPAICDDWLADARGVWPPIGPVCSVAVRQSGQKAVRATHSDRPEGVQIACGAGGDGETAGRQTLPPYLDYLAVCQRCGCACASSTAPCTRRTGGWIYRRSPILDAAKAIAERWAATSNPAKRLFAVAGACFKVCSQGVHGNRKTGFYAGQSSAGGGTRTLKLFRAMAPKTIASANFATPAACRSYRLRRRRVVGKGLDEFARPDS